MKHHAPSAMVLVNVQCVGTSQQCPARKRCPHSRPNRATHAGTRSLVLARSPPPRTHTRTHRRHSPAQPHHPSPTACCPRGLTRARHGCGGPAARVNEGKPQRGRGVHNNSRGDSSSSRSQPATNLDVLGHDGHTLGMDGAQVGVLKQAHQVRLGGLLRTHPTRKSVSFSATPHHRTGRAPAAPGWRCSGSAGPS